MKKFVALARVSSREQEREGFSLDIQVDALKNFAANDGGEIIEMWRIAETASKQRERKVFKELVSFVKKNAAKLDGVLVYKIDRAARNLFDYVELERLEAEYGVPVICLSQPTDNSPAGRMARRTLTNIATFYTEQQSVDVQEGLGLTDNRRTQNEDDQERGAGVHLLPLHAVPQGRPSSRSPDGERTRQPTAGSVQDHENRRRRIP